MKKILILDAFSTMHVGNGVLLENTIKVLDKSFEKYELDILTADIETNKSKYSNLHSTMFGDFGIKKNKFMRIIWTLKQLLFMLLQIINEFTFKVDSKKLTFDKYQKEVIAKIENSDICISIGGEMIGDTFYRTLPFWLFNFWFCIQKGKKFLLFPQSIGPLKKSWTKKLVKIALNDSTLLMARDNESFKTLQSLGFNEEQIIYIPDVGIWQETLENICINDYFSEKNDKKVLGITISKPPVREMGREIDFVDILKKELISLDTNEYKILLMPSNYIRNGVSSDYSVCLNLKKELEKYFDTAILDNRIYFPKEYTSLLNQLDFFISTRMHVAILSTSIYIPTITINTQHKIKGYMKNIKMSKYCLDYEELNSLSDLILDLKTNQLTIKKILVEENNRIKNEYLNVFNKIKTMCND